MVTAVFPETDTYVIGDPGPGGIGKVFYITAGGKHGLVAASADMATTKTWIFGGLTQVNTNGGTLESIGSGMANTIAITGQYGHSGSAAQLCMEYTEGGFNDWFLPSKDELHELYVNRASVDGTFEKDYYWSSTEYSKYSAYHHYFIDPPEPENNYSVKSSFNHVRAIREF